MMMCCVRFSPVICKIKSTSDVMIEYIDKIMIFVTGTSNLTPGKIPVLKLMTVSWIACSKPLSNAPRYLYVLMWSPRSQDTPEPLERPRSHTFTTYNPCLQYLVLTTPHAAHTYTHVHDSIRIHTRIHLYPHTSTHTYTTSTQAHAHTNTPILPTT